MASYCALFFRIPRPLLTSEEGEHARLAAVRSPASVVRAGVGCGQNSAVCSKNPTLETAPLPHAGEGLPRQRRGKGQPARDMEEPVLV
jgi:hypothetical protein